MGDHIAEFVKEHGDEGVAWERRLWRFVSQATENSLDGEKLHSVYIKVVGAPPAYTLSHPPAHVHPDNIIFEICRYNPNSRTQPTAHQRTHARTSTPISRRWSISTAHDGRHRSATRV